MKSRILICTLLLALAAVPPAAAQGTGTSRYRIPNVLDDIGYCSGDNGTAANRPQLVITYQ